MGYEQFLLHGLGDYILQTDWMANNKVKSWKAAFIHALTYSIPFALLTQHLAALFIIFFTHMLIDHYRLAAPVIRFKNSLTDWKGREKFNTPTGFTADTPAWMATWLFIITDNVMHLIINYLAIKFF